MSRRFAAAGQSRRSGRLSGSAASAAAVVPDPPATIFGGGMIHAYDANVSCTAGQWNDLVLSDHLLQATGGNQPAITSAGALSYAQFDGSTDRMADTTVTNFGGDTTLFCVTQFLTAEANVTPFCGSTSGGLRIGVTGSDVSGFTARVVDATGSDDMVSLVPGDTNIHLFVIRNATGVARKFYVDGGAGVAGARTQAVVTTTRIVVGAGGAAGATENAHCRSFYNGIVLPGATVAQINAVGAWYAWRFASLGAAWSTAS